MRTALLCLTVLLAGASSACAAATSTPAASQCLSWSKLKPQSLSVALHGGDVDATMRPGHTLAGCSGTRTISVTLRFQDEAGTFSTLETFPTIRSAAVKTATWTRSVPELCNASGGPGTLLLSMRSRWNARSVTFTSRKTALRCPVGGT